MVLTYGVDRRASDGVCLGSLFDNAAARRRESLWPPSGLAKGLVENNKKDRGPDNVQDPCPGFVIHSQDNTFARKW